MIKKISIFTSIFVICLSSTIYAKTLYQDVAENSYYSEAVTRLVTEGAITTPKGGVLKVNESITVGEFLDGLLYIADAPLYDIDSVEFARLTNLIVSNVNINKPITRLEASSIIMKVYDLRLDTSIKKESFLDTDLKVATIMKQNNIFNGVEVEKGYKFLPTSYFIRADCYIVLDRLNSNFQSIYQRPTKVGVLTFKEAPSTISDFELILQEATKEDDLEIEIPYNLNMYNEEWYNSIEKNLKTAFMHEFKEEPETYGYTNGYRYVREYVEGTMGDLKITLIPTIYTELTPLEIHRRQSVFKEDAKRERDKLYASGKITSTMSELERFNVFFDLVLAKTLYRVEDTPDVYTGYGVVNGVAVCQGYVAYLHELCNLDGIKAEGVTGNINTIGIPHIWSKVQVDGEWRYFDVTFADTTGNKAKYFNKTYEEIMIDRAEDKY